ncbi:MAG TPA: hypothetical protein VKU44_04625 [Terriglobia bacterium]|nr:hypothetical protein [Terriglobia bacterium]
MSKSIRSIAARTLVIPPLVTLLLVTAKADQDRGDSAPRLDAWTILGPGGGGAQFYPAVSPHDPNLVLAPPEHARAGVDHIGLARIEGEELHRLAQIEQPPRIAAVLRNVGPGHVAGALYRSTDGGKSWRNVLDRDQHVYDVTLDPRDPPVLYACGFESSAWRSSDRGETWSRIRGYNFKWGHRVVPDPESPALIYVTTFGGSVWHGPAARDPHAPEDIATRQLAYSR